jgi:hypothetical protein
MPSAHYFFTICYALLLIVALSLSDVVEVPLALDSPNLQIQDDCEDECESPGNNGPCITFPQDGSMIVKEQSRFIVSFKQNEAQQNANQHAFLELSCIGHEDASYTVYLNGRQLKSFYAKNVAVDHGGCFNAIFVLFFLLWRCCSIDSCVRHALYFKGQL